MDIHKQIDTTFDFRSDTPPGKDPDALSPTLRKYHKLLWSKVLPSGKFFELADTTPAKYLYHKSEIGEFVLTSDAVIPTFTKEKKLLQIFNQIPSEEIDRFKTIGYTIGGMMVFPGNRIGGKITINGARGFNPLIKDCFDLTVECIKRHYNNEQSPLSDVFARYADFFALFVDFRQYAEFFLLQDLVSEDFTTIKFFMPFDDFNSSPLPKNKESYIAYKHLAINFIKARNHRILEANLSAATLS